MTWRRYIAHFLGETLSESCERRTAMKRLVRSCAYLLALVVPALLSSACSDAPTSTPAPSTVSQLKPRAFAVCAYGQWLADGSCTGTVEYCTDNTPQSGAFCNQAVCFMDCNGGGGYGGYTPTAHYDTIQTFDYGDQTPDPEFSAPERINAYGFILKNQYVKNTEFQLNYKHDTHLHYFFITSGLFNRNNWGVRDNGASGWRGNYSLTIQNFITNVRAGTPGEQLLWATRIAVASTLKPLMGNNDEVIGGFSQIGDIQGSFIGIHYR